MAAGKDDPKRSANAKTRRAERLAAELRTNLKRRKDAQGDRAPAAFDTDYDTESGEKPRR